jgi:DUF2905 family protein
MSGPGKTLIIGGLLIAAAGVLVTLAGKLPWLGRLPGDIYLRRGHFTFYFPLTTSILLSVLISLVIWLLRK